MKRAYRKLISVLLVCALCFSLVPFAVFAEESRTEGLPLAEPQTEEVQAEGIQPEEAEHEHVYKQSEYIAPSCEAEGSILYLCACGNSYTEAVSATGHNYQLTETVEATAAEAGYLVYTCSNCGASYTEEIKAAGQGDGLLQELPSMAEGSSEIPATEKNDISQGTEPQQANGDETGTEPPTKEALSEGSEKDSAGPAADDEEKVPEGAGHDSGQYINPFFSDSLTEDQLAQPKDQQRTPLYASAEYSSVDEAVLQLRSMLMNRSESFEIHYTYASDVYDKGLNPSYLFSAATAHNGIPNAGDYLAFTLMWYKWEVSYFPKDGSYYLSAVISCSYTDTYEEELRTGEAVDHILAGLNLSQKTPYEKAKAIYDYLTTNITYDYSYSNYSGYNALVDHHAVCQGIALAFYRLALSTGLDARLVSSREMNHGWNITCIDGSYYYLDATWDLGNYPDYKYFLLGRINWQKNHQYGDEFDNGEFSAYAVPDADYTSSWKEKFTVKYDANGGSGAPSAQTKTAGAALTLSSMQPTRTGYTFQGWATSSTGSPTYQPGGRYTADADVTLYAVWKQNDPSGAKRSFIQRLYEVCLGRSAADSEVEYYVREINDRGMTGAEAAYKFIFADEFKIKNYCDRHYTEALYKAFMGRTPAEDEISYYVYLLQQGSTREDVFNLFIRSDEFSRICAKAGIAVGNEIEYSGKGTRQGGYCTVAGCTAKESKVAFAARLYKVCLDRSPAQNEIESWHYYLVHGDHTGTSASEFFLFSEEFIGKKYSDEDFVRHLYDAMMDRNGSYSADELAYWCWMLGSNGMTREEAFKEFAASDEFKVICQQYGVNHS